VPLTRRWLLPAAVCSLAACLALTAVSFWESFALRWGREAVGVTGGVAVFYRSGATPQPLSLVHARWTGAGNIPGAVLLGFHFLHDPSRAGAPLLIGVPMWFPTTLSLAALLVAVRVRSRRSAP